MRFPALLPIEQALRSARDRFIFRPLAAQRHVQRHARAEFDLVVKAFADHRIAFDPRDRVIGYCIDKFGDWFREDFRSVVGLLEQSGRSPRGKVFLDVGANIGTQTVYALVGDDFARAVCFEPAPRNVMALKTNMVINGLEQRASIIPKAVGEASGSMKLMLDGINSGGHSFRHGTSDGPKSDLTVDITTIDTELADLEIEPAEIGLVWMDVEGYEPEALAGAERLLAARVPLCLEFNSHVYGPAGTAALLDRLAGAGYTRAMTIGRTPARTFAPAAIDADQLPGDFLFL